MKDENKVKCLKCEHEFDTQPCLGCGTPVHFLYKYCEACDWEWEMKNLQQGNLAWVQ